MYKKIFTYKTDQFVLTFWLFQLFLLHEFYCSGYVYDEKISRFVNNFTINTLCGSVNFSFVTIRFTNFSTGFSPLKIVSPWNSLNIFPEWINFSTNSSDGNVNYPLFLISIHLLFARVDENGKAVDGNFLLNLWWMYPAMYLVASSSLSSLKGLYVNFIKKICFAEKNGKHRL